MKLSGNQQDMLDLARREPGIAKAEVARRLGVRGNAAAGDLYILRRYGLLKPSPPPEDPTYGQLWPVETGDSP